MTRSSAAGRRLAPPWTIGEGVWLALCTAAMVAMAHTAFVTGRTVLSHDSIYWTYPIYHFFADSLHRGQFPFWNPFVHGGEPFGPLLLHARLLDPVCWAVLALGRVGTDDIVLLFNWDRLARGLFAAFGSYLLLRAVATHWLVRACLPPLLLWSSFLLTSFQQPGTLDAFMCAPFVMYFAFRLLHDEDRRWRTWIGLAVFVGMSWQSVFYVGVWLLLLFLLVGFVLFDRGALVRLVRAPETARRAAVAVLFVAGMALPNVVMLREQSGLVFPARMLDHSWVGQIPRGAMAQYSPGTTAVEFDSLFLPYGVIHYTGTFVPAWNFVAILAPRVHEHVRENVLGPPLRGATEGFMYLGVLGYVGAVVGLLAGRHPLKRVWLTIALAFGLLSLGPAGGLHWALQVLPPLRAVRHAANLVDFFVLGLVFFFVLGANRAVDWITAPTRGGASPVTPAATTGGRVMSIAGAAVVTIVLGKLLTTFIDWSAVPRPLPFLPTEALLIVLAVAVIVVARRWLPAAAIVVAVLVVSVVGAIAHVVAFDIDVVPTVLHLAGFLTLPLLLLWQARRMRRWRTLVLAGVVAVLIADLAVYFHASSALWRWARPEGVAAVSTRLGEKDGVPDRVVTLPVRGFPYWQAVRYLPLVARQPAAFDGIFLPFGAHEGYFSARAIEGAVENGRTRQWSGKHAPGSSTRVTVRVPASPDQEWLWARLWVKSDTTVGGAVALNVTQGPRVSTAHYGRSGTWQPVTAGLPLASSPRDAAVIARVTAAAGAPASFKDFSLRIGPGAVKDPRGFDLPLVQAMTHWNTLLMPRHYREAIFGKVPVAALAHAFAINQPLAQFRPAAAPERELGALAGLPPARVAERMRDTVYLPDAMPPLQAGAAMNASRDERTGSRRTASAAQVVMRAWDGQSLEADVEATRAGYLYVADGYDPHWHATVDGQRAPVLRANVAFKAIPVATGRHRVRLEYRPTAFRLALWTYGALTACGLGVVLGSAARDGWRRRRHRDPGGNA
jgi:hypothetical protein